jgi:hypothetical protein
MTFMVKVILPETNLPVPSTTGAGLAYDRTSERNEILKSTYINVIKNTCTCVFGRIPLQSL